MSSFRDRVSLFPWVFGLLFPSQILSLLHHWIPGSEDGLRLRWDAVRGFFVENLFEYLSCFSEFRNPDLAVVILVDMLEGGFDCLHLRCPQLHLLFACSVQVSMYIIWRCFAVLPCWGSTTLASKAWEDRRYRRDSELLSDKLKMQAEDFRIKQHLQCFPNGFSAYDLFTTEVNRWHPLQWTLLHLAPTAFWFYRCSDGVLVDDFIEAIGPWGICWSQWPTSSSNGLCGEGMVDFLWHLISMQFCPVKLIFLNTNISMAQRGPYIEQKCHFGIL